MASPKKSKSIPTSHIGRLAKLIGTGAGLVGHEISLRLNQAFRNNSPEDTLSKRMAQARACVESLSQLKGAAMKVGQILSIELSDLLPQEVTQMLRTLHDDSLAMDISRVHPILKKELGAQKYAQLRDISEKPIAAASIGQVHTATVQGLTAVG
jgi:predicted unusual protein kinase regulating ubiquinone biosynthesis (AarF/ABC1/UbiB family)